MRTSCKRSFPDLALYKTSLQIFIPEVVYPKWLLIRPYGDFVSGLINNPPVLVELAEPFLQTAYRIFFIFGVSKLKLSFSHKGIFAGGGFTLPFTPSNSGTKKPPLGMINRYEYQVENHIYGRTMQMSLRGNG